MTLGDPAFVGRPAAGGGGGAYNPLTAISWAHAYWAEDPSWTPPADGAKVSSWRNAGSAGGNATQGTDAARPIYRSSYATLNSKPAVENTGASSDNYLQNTAGALAQPFTIAVVGHLLATGAPKTLVTGKSGSTEARIATSGSAWRLYAGTVVDAGTSNAAGHLFVAYYNGASSTLEVDGSVVVGPANAGTWTLEGMSLLGTFIGSQYGGGLSFAAAVSGAISSGDKAALRSWSQTHYGTP